jgi:hypothetical protein
MFICPNTREIDSCDRRVAQNPGLLASVLQDASFDFWRAIFAAATKPRLLLARLREADIQHLQAPAPNCSA